MKKASIFVATFVLAAALFGLTACQTIQKSGGERADMSGYATYDAGTDYVFVKSTIREMYDMVNRKETFVIYFGFAKCPWCRDLMPVLNEAARKSRWSTVYYANTRENPEWKSNIDMDDYGLLVDMAFDYLDYDENGIKHLDAPTVYFVKDGVVKTAVFAPKYDAPKVTIPDDLRAKLMDDLLAAFKSLK